MRVFGIVQVKKTAAEFFFVPERHVSAFQPVMYRRLIRLKHPGQRSQAHPVPLHNPCKHVQIVGFIWMNDIFLVQFHLHQDYRPGV